MIKYGLLLGNKNYTALIVDNGKNINSFGISFLKHSFVVNSPIPLQNLIANLAHIQIFIFTFMLRHNMQK